MLLHRKDIKLQRVQKSAAEIEKGLRAWSVRSSCGPRICSAQNRRADGRPHDGGQEGQGNPGVSGPGRAMLPTEPRAARG